MNLKHLSFAGAVFLIASLNGRVFADVKSAPRPSAESLARPCLACHAGPASPGIPDIRGGSEQRFVERMREFRDNDRSKSVMTRIARGYRDEDYLSMARYFRTLGRNKHPLP